jgi:ferredoxin
MIVYFTGTGNSRYIAQMIADKTGDQIVDAGECIKESRKSALTSDRPWVFAAPTYAWRLPRVFVDYLLRSSFAGSKEAYFVMTCGDDIGNAGKDIQKLCTKKSFTYMGVFPSLMPENYVAMFDVPDKEKAAKIIKAAEEKLQNAIPFITKREPFPTARIGFSDCLKTAVANPMLYRFVVKAAPFYTTDACVGCGKCAQHCPLNNITLIDGKPRWGKSCTHCMACICKCPTKAIEYGNRSKGKPRYQCPEYVKGGR